MNSRALGTDTYVQMAGKLLILSALWAAVWLAGGFYALPGFLCLSLLCAALIPLWLEPLRCGAVFAQNRRWLVLISLFLAYAAMQSLPIGDLTTATLTGVQKTRKFFSDSSALYPLTLSPWHSKNWLAMIMIGISGFFLSMLFFRTERSILLLLSAISICGITQVMWGVVQAARFPNYIFWNFENPGHSSPFGTFLNRNHGADFVGMTFASLLGVAWYRHKKESGNSNLTYETRSLLQSISSSPFIVLLCVGLTWLVVGLACTTSRGGWISFLLAVFCVPTAWRKTAQRRGRLITVVSLMCIIAAGIGVHVLGMGDRIERKINALEFSRLMADGRLVHWKEALPAVEHYFVLGAGAGTYGFAYLPFHPKPADGWFTYAHNQYLETLVEFGLVGIALLAAVMFLTFKACRSLCQSDRSAIQQGLGVASLFALLMQAFHAVTDFGLMMPGNALTLGLILGAAISAATEVKRNESYPQIKITKADYIFGLATAVALSAALGLALQHQKARVRGDQLLSQTEFSPSTPEPGLSETRAWIAKLSDELERAPENETLFARLIQLRIHEAQRTSFDRIFRRGLDVTTAWDSTSVELTIARLFDESQTSLSSRAKESLFAATANYPGLKLSRANLQSTLALNAVQPRAHFRAAQLAAVMGAEWQPSLSHSCRLAVVDPSLSLGNGLLAWAMNDPETMIRQWRQTLQNHPAQGQLIIKLSTQKLSSSEVVDRLIPDQWQIAYSLAMRLTAPEQADLKTRLLRKAKKIAATTLGDSTESALAQAKIASANQDYLEAIRLTGKAVGRMPNDAEIRFSHAQALFSHGNYGEAVNEARVAVLLAPNIEKYRHLFESAKERQSSN